jgi:hypothetical protein
MASAILFRAAAPIFRRFLAAGLDRSLRRGCRALQRPSAPLWCGPSIERTWAICSSSLFRCSSKPARAAFNILVGQCGCCRHLEKHSTVEALLILGDSSDDGREDLKSGKAAIAERDAGLDKTARKACVSSEPANSTLLAPFRAQYHKFAVASRRRSTTAVCAAARKGHFLNGGPFCHDGIFAGDHGEEFDKALAALDRARAIVEHGLRQNRKLPT